MAEVESTVSSGCSFETVLEKALPAQLDCVAWNLKYNVLAVGAYQLDEKDNTLRLGKLFIVRILEDDAPDMNILDEISLLGVLDIKFDKSENFLAVACAKSVVCFRMDQTGETVRAVEVWKHCLEDDALALYLQWLDTNRILFSDSLGCVSTLIWEKVEGEDATQDEIGTPTLQNSAKLHESLTWVVHWANGFIFAGDDIGIFMAFHESSFENLAILQKRRYDMGITSISSRDDFLAVGSYDEILRIFQFTGDSEFLTLTLKFQVNFGGGIWRTCWLKQPEGSVSKNIHNIAVSCMRNGICVLEIDFDKWTSSQLFSYTKHTGYLAYGFDVKSGSQEGSCVIATGYFDNHILHVCNLKNLPN